MYADAFIGIKGSYLVDQAGDVVDRAGRAALALVDIVIHLQVDIYTIVQGTLHGKHFQLLPGVGGAIVGRSAIEGQLSHQLPVVIEGVLPPALPFLQWPEDEVAMSLGTEQAHHLAFEEAQSGYRAFGSFDYPPVMQGLACRPMPERRKKQAG